MMRLIYWLCVLLLWNFLNAVNAAPEFNQCAKCASNYIVYQWENVLLNRNMRSVEEISGDDTCQNEFSKHTSVVKCYGQCATFSVVANRDGHEYLFGVYRDCSDSGSFNNLLKKLESDSSRLEIDLEPVRKFERKIVFELCEGYLCNGNREQRQIPARDFSVRPRKNSANTCFVHYLFIVGCTTLFFLSQLI
ncbi:hypothetical protein M3Y97_00075400 [Aphelenchoides bicaudatus]|nr:hypothetical protein M3Y97_00075400 [Aphelenchoides bicaudatus]